MYTKEPGNMLNSQTLTIQNYLRSIRRSLKALQKQWGDVVGLKTKCEEKEKYAQRPASMIPAFHRGRLLPKCATSKLKASPSQEARC
jgi:hypothetical protein